MIKIKPREKLEQFGFENLTEKDLISLIIGKGIKGQNYEQISEQVCRLIKKQEELIDNEFVSEIKKIKGIGNTTAYRIYSSIELGKRLFGKQQERRKITSSESAYELVRSYCDKKQEYLIAIFLNVRYELLGKKVVSIGTVDRLSANPRDIIIPALERNATAVVLAHNHPSGNPEPSDEDKVFNSKLEMALDLVGINLLDHIIISKNGWKILNS